MAAKNWREANEPNPRKKPSQPAPTPRSGESLQLGPVVRTITLVLTAIALAASIWLLIDNLKPNQKTAFFSVNNEKADVASSAFAGTFFKGESLRQFSNSNSNLNLLDDLGGKPQTLGPNENVALFYSYQDFSMDSNDQLLVSKSHVSSSILESESWRPLRDQLKRICATSGQSEIKHRIVLLDIGEVDEAIRMSDAPLSEMVKNLLIDMKTEGTNGVEDLWILISADKHQRSWYAPELGSSVFAFFAARGLEGWAKSANGKISLDGYTNYVRSSVSRWTRDYRDSTQEPQLITLADPKTSSSVAVIFAATPKPPSVSVDDYQKSGIDDLWKDLTSARKTHGHLPHALARIESLLLRLEACRYGSVSGNFRSADLFAQIKKQTRQLLGGLRPVSEPRTTALSLNQIENDEFMLSAQDRSELSKWLFTPPEPVVVDPAADKDAAASVPDAAGVIPETLSSLDQTHRLKLVWDYFCSSKSTNDSLSSAQFKKCVALVQSGMTGELVPVLNSKPVPLQEFQWLQILEENVAWHSPEDPRFPTQRENVLQSIRIRNLADTLIYGTSSNGNGNENELASHARAWPTIRQEFLETERLRRSKEDQLLANIDLGPEAFQPLRDRYSALLKKLNTAKELRSLASEAIRITPHLKLFLAREGTLREATPKVKSIVSDVSDLQELADESLTSLAANQLDSENADSLLNKLSQKMESLKDSFRSQFEEGLLGDESASNVVFNGMNYLESPLPEWLGLGGTTNRETVRANLDRWIEKQRQTLLVDGWKEFNSKADFPPERTTLTATDLKTLFRPSNVSTSTLPTLSSESILALGEQLAAFGPTGATFKSHFNRQEIYPSGLDELPNAMLELDQLDLAVRSQVKNLSLVNSSLDVGSELRLLDELSIAHDLAQRVVLDAWGSGNVEDLIDTAEQPVFLKYAEIAKSNLQVSLDRFHEFKKQSGSNTTVQIPDSLLKSTEQPLVDAKALWKQIQATTLAPVDSSGTFARGENVDVRMKLGTELTVGNADSNEGSVWGSYLMLNGEQAIPPGTFRSNAPLAIESTIPTGSLKGSSQFNSFRAEATFRGHRFVSEFKKRESRPQQVAKLAFKSSFQKPDPAPPRIQVRNGTEYEADIIFILDCSLSMMEKVTGRLNQGGQQATRPRFDYAKGALKATVENLFLEGRFKFALYAFGHRVKFKEFDYETKRYRVSSTKYHPFDDAYWLFRLRDNPKDVSTAKEKNKIQGLIDEQSALGITPLYYSIRMAAINEFSTEAEGRKRYIVVLTDGVNNQINSTDPTAVLPKNKTLNDVTTIAQVQSVLEARGISREQLIIGKIYNEASQAKKSPAELAKEKRAESELDRAGFTVLNMLDNNSSKISETILDAIGRNEFSVAKPGRTGDRMKIGPRNSVTVDEFGEFEVTTFGVETPSKFPVVLEGGESVFFENTATGLVLDIPEPKFLGDAASNNGKVTTSFESSLYDIGQIKAGAENKLAFGFHKANRWGKYGNFSLRPKRVWAQIIDRKSGITANAFLPDFDTGAYPVAQFVLPQQLIDTADQVDIRLWIVPNDRDKKTDITDPFKINPILPDTENVLGMPCQRIETGDDEFTVRLSPKNDPRGFFVNCPEFEQFSMETRFENNSRTEVVYQFTVPRKNANFSLSILPLEDFQSIMSEVDSDDRRTGTSRDPIFGDEAYWVKFDNVTLK